ncbi:NADH-quinone oxidoreductase subunit L [candidate division KSB1 bacterium]
MDNIGLILLFPLIGVIINGFFGKRLSEKVISFIGPGMVGISFLVSVSIFLHMLSLPEEERQIRQTLFTWISSGSLNVNFAFLFDQLSGTLALIVTGVGFLIHVYSVGYMHGDKGYARYFTYLNLFIFMMLILILGSSYLLLFIGWEGVGLCSYLLIGFWFEDNNNANAGKKAFVVNRIGDFGFLLGMFLMFKTFGSLEFGSVFSQASALTTLNDAAIVGITLLLFVGAVGKSAQIPLFVWLPDAMAGPTPVSALIHAATMVTAGVYMVARSSVLYALAPSSMMVVAAVGAVTALFAATIGIAQNDIKKVLAYSTVSQLGYMCLAVGVGAFSAGVFHLMTHAFFKALLFLGAGSVIHALSGEQDMRYMGGLRKHMPTTFKTFIIATLAIAGAPLFSGFFSKDEILWFSFASQRGNIAFWFIGLLAAGITAFYMFRLVFMTFFGESRVKPEAAHHLHESPKTITIPLMILAALSLIGGWIGIPESLGGHNQFEHFMHPVFADAQHIIEQSGEMRHGSIEYVLMVLAIAVAFTGFFIAYTKYFKKPYKEPVTEPGFGYKLLENKYYVDEIYEASVIKPFMRSSNFFWKGIDIPVIDGIVNGSGWLFRKTSQMLRKIQSGLIQEYIVIFIIGCVFVFGYMLFK